MPTPNPNPDQPSRMDRIQQLIARRHELALRWAQAMAHGGPAVEALNELMALEEMLSLNWPRIWARHHREWITQDARLVHSEANPIPECPTCRAAAPAEPLPTAA